ncbi:L-threonylcarbamoyladenylate synthase [Cytophaga hutchinsonii]|uniref:Threonylcarbamoyl-AMP synthase n=1 Tax=Cytophaga hutchinsonii (strain ATCC 33406 / DSM 1761 / CIP 103989 / NBRC 15051 / NCIMB 9469 / D465) TaxID=269798 RepID=A0A6N4STY3_CYTH3|nr:L-threonylcarbamoyladenylate synthase [Cytophaga hutchinsonii]ABG59674.1 translation factor SUA5 [Cytophaga hutchinsonii ATCC 33406]SFX66165.1 translation factor SUA5 [Cytophaga hutchinsonii ATCC 33406]
MNKASKTGVDITQAKRLLEENHVVAIPTETVYGLAGNALDIKAVATIFSVKKRPSFDPLIVHTHSIEALGEFVADIPEQAQLLAKAFWPGPLTLLLEKKEIIPDLVTSGLNRVAVRIPNHPLTLALLQSLSFPLAAPSANPFGYISPTTAQHVTDQLGDQVAYILDGGASNIGVESTIIGWENGKATVMRVGGLSIEAIEAIIGPVHVQAVSSSNPAAPGMLKSHYAPRIPMRAGNIETLLQTYAGKKIAVLSFQQAYPAAYKNYILSPEGNVTEAAQHLFAAMRVLDTSEADIILTEYVPAVGLGLAINDRLKRACAEEV